LTHLLPAHSLPTPPWAAQPLLTSINPATNASRAFGTFCGMPNLVGNICMEMPRMKGCEAWLALCSNATSVVAACRNPGPIPGVLWTYATKEAVDAVCAASPGAPPTACANCTSTGRQNFAACPDPTTTLSTLCYGGWVCRGWGGVPGIVWVCGVNQCV